MDVATLELLHEACASRDASCPTVNTRMRSRTFFWHAVDACVQFVDAIGIARRSSFVREIANDKGSTPLHKAASIGRLDLVQWLLAHGAEPSLRVRNARGNTPLHIARLFGPYPDVEAELRSAQAILTATDPSSMRGNKTRKGEREGKASSTSRRAVAPRPHTAKAQLGHCKV